MTTWHPPHRIAVPAAQQQWRSIAFVHWRYDPADVARLLPDGVAVDTYDGTAWVGLTPFAMDAGVVPVAPGPTVRTDEVNVRTYVRVGDAQGLWFLSLDIDKGIVAKGLRALLRLPYRTSRIRVDRQDGRVDYRLRGGESDGARRLDMTVEVGQPVAEDEVDGLEVFLLARWRAFTQAYGRLVSVPVAHRSWPLRRATLSGLTGNLLEAADLPPPVGEAHVAFSDGVHTRLGWPRPVPRRP